MWFCLKNYSNYWMVTIVQNNSIPDNPYADIRILSVQQEQVTPGASFGPVFRNVYIIECCTEGAGTITIDGKCFPFCAGDCYVLLSGSVATHTANPRTGRSGYWCALDGASLERIFRLSGVSNENPFLPSAQYPQIRDCFQQMLLQWNTQDAGAPLRQLGCIYTLLGLILERLSVPKSVPVLDRAIGYIQSNYADPLNVDMIAAQTGLERAYFSTLFRKKLGVSPYRYLNRLRVQKACLLLDMKNYRISEVAYLVGLEPHNFARLFKQETGITPQQYLRRRKQGHMLTNGRSKPMSG